jgi:hypothetical protein
LSAYAYQKASSSVLAPLFQDISEEMDEAELALSRSTPGFQLG